MQGVVLISMKVEKEKFDLLLQKMLQQKPEKAQAIKGPKQQPRPIISKPKPSEPR
jgi:hypothetical protein